jgi:hypothetical protein
LDKTLPQFRVPQSGKSELERIHHAVIAIVTVIVVAQFKHWKWQVTPAKFS